MTELMFPSGVVRIDEGHVWRELSKWVSATGGDVVLRGDGTVFSVLLKHKHDEWYGRSHLSLGDAVAQALQTAVAA